MRRADFRAGPNPQPDISDLIRHVSQQIGSTTVMTSHDVNNSFRIANRILIINESRIAAIGTASQLKAMKEPFVQEFLQGAAANNEWSVVTEPRPG